MSINEAHFMTILRCAIMAPSGHNTQPWLFLMRENGIRLKPDFSRALPCVDSDNRELYISLGCAIKNCEVAATLLGYKANVIITPQGDIDIEFEQTLSPSDSLLSFDSISRRQTNRRIYQSTRIESKKMDDCIAAAAHLPNIQIYHWQKEDNEFNYLKAAILDGNCQQMADPCFISELSAWIRYNKAHVLQKLDGIGYDAFGAPNLPYWLSKRIMRTFLKAKKQNVSDIKRIDSSSYFVLLTTKNNAITEWINLGRQLQHLLLEFTQANFAHSYLNQPCEIKSLARKLQYDLPINHEFPTILLRVGYAKPMPYSKRRALSEVLISEE